MKRLRRIAAPILISLGLAAAAPLATAQDLFEVGVYGYETGPRAAWETHLIDIASGTRVFDGSVAPDKHHVDMRFGKDLVLNAGIGRGTTSAGNRLVFKSRCEIPFGTEPCSPAK